MWRLGGLELAPMLRLPNVTGIAGPRRMTTLRRSSATMYLCATRDAY
jgi:hypothetical protein